VKNVGFAYRVLDDELNEKLTWESRQFRNTVQSWVNKRFMPLVTECYLDGRFPMELVPEMTELGLFGIKADPIYGGHGLNNYDYGLICRELEAGDSGLRSFVSVQNSLVIYPIERFGSEDQKKRWLPLLTSGKAIGAFGLTGPEGGSDPENMKTHARKDGNDFMLNGSKQFITNGSIADVVIVWAKLDGIVRGFLVEKGTSGLESREMKKKLSLCASNTSELFLSGVRVPADSLLPGTMERERTYLSCLNEARYGIAWGAVGVAIFCAEAALEYVRNRVLFGESLTKKQLIQEKLVFMDVNIESALRRMIDMARLKESGKIRSRDISCGKMVNVDMACEVSRLARRMIAGNGIMAEYHVMRHMMNLESVYTYEGTNEIHMLALGRDITGENAF